MTAYPVADYPSWIDDLELRIDAESRRERGKRRAREERERQEFERGCTAWLDSVNERQTVASMLLESVATGD